jgi:hypothetical protein
MKWFWHSFISSIILLTSWYQATPVSYFRNMRWEPYVKNQTYLFNLEFAYPPGGPMAIEVRLSNTVYNRALIIALNMNASTLIQTPVVIYPYLFDQSGSLMLYFRAYRNQFESTLQVRVYEKESKNYLIHDQLLSVGSNKPTAEVNAVGVISYRHETIALQGFQSLIVEPYFYAMHFRYWTLKSQHAWKKLTNIHVTFTILSTHPAFILIDPTSQMNKKIGLHFTAEMDVFKSRLREPLYVDLQTLIPSSLVQEGYVETESLFFPINSFASLKTIEFKMDLVVAAIHQYTLTYFFTYETLKPLLGPCYQARYCVGVA